MQENRLSRGRRAGLAGVVLGAALAGTAGAGDGTSPKPTGNLVRNPGFAEGLRHWSVGPIGRTPRVEPVVDRGAAPAGDAPALRLGGEAGKRTVVRQVGIPRDPGVRRYRFSVWTRAAGLSGAWMARFGVQSTRDEHGWRTFQNRHVSCGAIRDWGRTVIEFEPPDGTKQMAVYVATWFDEHRPPARPAKGAGVWFADVCLRPVPDEQALRRAARARPRIAVDSFHPLGRRGLFRPGEPVRLLLAARNHGAKAADLDLAVEVRDFSHRPVARRAQKLSLAQGAARECPIELSPPPGRGFFCARATLREGGRQVAAASAGFCVIEPVPHKDPFFGIDPNGLTPDLLEALGVIGVGSLGVHASWRVPKAELGNVKGYMQAQVKRHLSAYLRSEFHLVGYVKIDPEFHPAWSRQETLARRRRGLFPYPDALFELLGDVVEAEAVAMKDRVRTWIVQEEIDAWMRKPEAPAGSGTCELARHILATRIACERLKKVDPGFVVAGLSVCGDYRGDPPYPLVRRVLPELRGCLDLLAPDMYCGAYDFSRTVVSGPELGGLRKALIETRRVQAAAGMGKELIIAEKGLGVAYHAPPDGPTNKTMADLTARNLIVARSAAPVKLYSHYLSAGSALWRIRERGYPSSDEAPVTDFGLWKRTLDSRGRGQYQPRPVVAAYATVARMLSGTADPIELNVRDGFYCYLFRRKGHTVAALWTTGDEPLRVRVSLPAASQHCDLMGNTRALARAPADLAAGRSPLFLVVPADPRAVTAALRKAAFPATAPR